MTADARIVVLNGVHAGASVALSAGQPLRIGSGADADLILIDAGIDALHVTVELSGAALALVAHQADVTAFGRRVAPGRRVLLQQGGWFSAGTIRFQFGGRDAGSATDMFGMSEAAEDAFDAAADPCDTQAARRAERAYLLRHAPLAYLAKRWSYASPRMKALVVGAPSGVVLLTWLAAMPPSDTPRAARTDDAFRLVTTHADTTSGALVYEGYVQSAADLAALTARAWSRQRAPVMHVIVLAQLQEQLDEFLARYYRGAEVLAAQPGAFIATLPGRNGFLSAESWDYARVARRARAELNGLRELRFPDHAQSGERVRVPLEALGVNLLAGRHAVWLTDAQGVRYFVGARLPPGRITRISACAADIARDDDGSIYEFFTDAAHAPKDCR